MTKTNKLSNPINTHRMCPKQKKLKKENSREPKIEHGTCRSENPLRISQSWM